MARLETLALKVALTDAQIERIRRRFPDLTVRVARDPAELPAAVADADAFVGRARDLATLTSAPRLRWIQTLTAGADRISLPNMPAQEIVLTNGSGIHAINMAEHILCLMLAFARDLPQLVHAQARHVWNQHQRQFELAGQTVCVVGLGDIGLAFAERATCIGMRATAVRRREGPVPPFIDRVVLQDELDALLPDADHVVICLPLTHRTRGLFDAARLARMKPGAYLYNIGRGELVDQDALIAALQAGRLAGAGLDVTTPEPLPPDSPLWDMERVIISAHTGGSSPDRFDRFVDLLLDNIARFRADQPLRNVVDPVEGY